MAKRYSKAAHSKRRKQTSHVLKNTVILLFCAVGIWFGSSLWHAALTLQTAQPAESIAGEDFSPQVAEKGQIQENRDFSLPYVSHNVHYTKIIRSKK